MPNWKRFSCILLAVFFTVVSGCATQPKEEYHEEENIQMGGYVETEITPPNWPNPETVKNIRSLGIFPAPDGSLDYLAIEMPSAQEQPQKLAHFRSVDSGNTWQRLDTEWYDILYEKYGVAGRYLILNAAMDHSKQIYCVIMTANNRMQMIKVSDKIVTEMNILEWNDPNFYTNLHNYMTHAFSILPNGDIAIALEQAGQYGRIYDGTIGAVKYQFKTDVYPALFMDESFLSISYLQKEHTYGFFKTDFNGNEQISHPLSLNPRDGFLLSNSGNKVFMITSLGIEQFENTFSESKTLLEGSMYSFGSPSCEIKYFSHGITDNIFYVILRDKKIGGEKLYRYTYDATLRSDTQPLSIFALKDSDTLRQAVSIFQVKHPEQKVLLEIGLVEGTAVTEEDVLRVLNTELLAKKGPDVLILDGLPIESYIEKGVLSDISDITEDQQYFTNITTAFSSEKGSFAVPARFKIPVLTGNKQIVDSLFSLSDVVNIAKDSPKSPADWDDSPLPSNERPLFLVNSPGDIIKLFYPSYFPALFDKKNTFDQNLLSELLLCTKELYTKYGSSNFLVLQENLSEAPINSCSPEDVYGEKTLLGITNLRDFSDCTFWAMAKPSQNGEIFVSPDLYIAPLCGPVKNIFIPSSIAAVNASSIQQESAKNFIRILLSEAVQKPEYHEGFPVNKLAFQFAQDRSKNDFMIRYAIDMEQIVYRLKTPVIPDPIVLEAVLQETLYYCQEEKTLEKAVNDIAASIRIYLAE